MQPLFQISSCSSNHQLKALYQLELDQEPILELPERLQDRQRIKLIPSKSEFEV